MLAAFCRLWMAKVMAEEPLASWLTARLGVELRRRSPVSGGCIHSAWRLELVNGGVLFAKGGDLQALGLLEAEADGLSALSIAAAGTDLIVPRPLALGRCADQALLVLDWLELCSTTSAGDGWRRLGRSLACLHRGSLERPCGAGDRLDGSYGWIRDNSIGASPQVNGWMAKWSDFFVQRRLLPQLEWLAGRGVRLRGVERLLAGIPLWLAEHRPEAVLVHGDLWSGNASLLQGGGGALFDPAVHRADREVDLAMARLFGGFPAPFFAGYAQEWPLPAGHQARIPLYNLYHLLNHANLFGSSYGAQAQATIDALLSHPPGL